MPANVVMLEGFELLHAPAYGHRTHHPEFAVQAAHPELQLKSAHVVIESNCAAASDEHNRATAAVRVILPAMAMESSRRMKLWLTRRSRGVGISMCGVFLEDGLYIRGRTPHSDRDEGASASERVSGPSESC